ncbi:MAG: hypothetical protein KC431_11000, partial [Myxococcales bacterium]|nr:hypothetical protein [Myxococcales bacterium]
MRPQRRSLPGLHFFLSCAVLLLPLACGGLGTDADSVGTTTGEPDDWSAYLDPVAGSRLRPIFRTADDGSRMLVGWLDTLFDTPCNFSHTPDAGLRCVPTTAGTDVWLYADADCTQPVLQDIWIPEGATVVRERGDSCFDHSYYQVGEAVDQIYYNANGPCQVFSNDPAHRLTLIAHEEFVSATLTPLESPNRIAPLLLQADDGSQQIFGAWDHLHGEEVAARSDTSEQLRWLGRWQPRVSTTYYADA